MRSVAEYRGGIAFESKSRGFSIVFDGAPEHGGQGLGQSPKEGLLASLGACTGMDVVSLFKKKSVSFEKFKVIAVAHPREQHPRIFEEVNVTYEVESAEANVDLMKDCVERSMSRYSPIACILAGSMPVFYTLVVNGEVQHRAQARFEGR